MSYHPGLHIVATLSCKSATALQTFEGFKLLADKLVTQFDLVQLGEVFHNFKPGGFTGVLCLSESHLSVHTWPEYGKVNLDIYLSNFERENDGTVKKIYAAFCHFFGGEIVHEEMIRR